MAYAQLLAEGYIISEPKVGYFVKKLKNFHVEKINQSHDHTGEGTESNINIDFHPVRSMKILFPFNDWRKLQKIH